MPGKWSLIHPFKRPFSGASGSLVTLTMWDIRPPSKPPHIWGCPGVWIAAPLSGGCTTAGSRSCLRSPRCDRPRGPTYKNNWFTKKKFMSLPDRLLANGLVRRKTAHRKGQKSAPRGQMPRNAAQCRATLFQRLVVKGRRHIKNLAMGLVNQPPIPLKTVHRPPGRSHPPLLHAARPARKPGLFFLTIQ